MTNPLTPAQQALATKHGTPDAFAEACYRAVPGEITLAEAKLAIRKYTAEWEAAGVPCALTRLLESLDLVRVDDGNDQGAQWIYAHDRLGVRAARLHRGNPGCYCVELEHGSGFLGASIQEAATEAVRNAHEVLLDYLDSDNRDHTHNVSALDHHIERLGILRALIAFDEHHAQQPAAATNPPPLPREGALKIVPLGYACARHVRPPHAGLQRADGSVECARCWQEQRKDATP